MNFHAVSFDASYGKASQLPASQRTEIVFAGRSNVGKSTLINKIFNRKNLARVSGVPGKTSTINFFRCGNLSFVDLPGYGYARVSKNEKQRWAELIEHYFHSDRDIALVLSLVDMRHPFSADDLNMLQFLMEMELPFIVVLTKADKLSKSQRAAQLAVFSQQIPEFSDMTVIVFSAVTGEGVDELRSIIETISSEEEEQLSQ